MSDEKRGCTCKWCGDHIIRFDRDCPRLADHEHRFVKANEHAAKRRAELPEARQ